MKPNTILAFLGGALVGAAIALLYAPEKGSDTRKKIKSMAENEFDAIKDKLHGKVAHEQEEAKNI